jgi:hypothetical protein
MLNRIPTRMRLASLVALVTVAGTAIIVGTVAASDHQDTPLVEMSPRLDVNDVYVFPSTKDADRTVLVLSTRSPLTPAQTPSADFGTRDKQLYQLKIDNTGDAREDLVFQITFTGTGANQSVELRGPVAPATVGTVNTLVGNPVITGLTRRVLDSSSGIELFAGPRDDPFYIDLEAFFRILPDRRPEAGPLSTITQGPLTFRPASSAVDYLRGINDLAIVIEVPTSMLANRATNGRFGVWGTTSVARGSLSVGR